MYLFIASRCAGDQVRRNSMIAGGIRLCCSPLIWDEAMFAMDRTCEQGACGGSERLSLSAGVRAVIAEVSRPCTMLLGEIREVMERGIPVLFLAHMSAVVDWMADETDLSVHVVYYHDEYDAQYHAGDFIRTLSTDS